MPDTGRPIASEEIASRWRPWSPGDVQDRLIGVDARWGIAAGWAIDLFLGEETRAHDDIEITVPAASFPAIAEAVVDLHWDVVGDGRLWPYPDALDRYRQAWLLDPDTACYVLDVIREPHDNDTWVYRRNPLIRMPLARLYDHNDTGILSWCQRSCCCSSLQALGTRTNWTSTGRCPL